MLKSRPFAAPLSLGALCVGAFLAAAPAAGAAEGYPRATVSALAPGQPVTVEGRVVRVTDEDEFLLADPTGQVEVYVRRARLPLLAGEAVTVRGVVDDDRSLEIYAEEVIRTGWATHPWCCASFFPSAAPARADKCASGLDAPPLGGLRRMRG